MEYERLKSLLDAPVLLGRPNKKYPMPTDVPYQIFKRYGSIAADKYLWRIREIKTAEERHRIEEAVKIALEILAALDWQRPEREVARALKIAALREADGLAFEPIVAADEHSRFPHWQAGLKEPRQHMLVDFGVKYEGYNSDITEMFFIKEMEEFDQLVESFKELSRLATPGRRVADLANNFPLDMHALGHGIGIEVHEPPVIHERSRRTLKAGMVIALEPAIYTDKWGMRYEREVFV